MSHSHAPSILELAGRVGVSAEDCSDLEAFGPILEAAKDPAEFDLAFWSLAQRLRTDTEELFRRVGSGWIRETGTLGELASIGDAMEAVFEVLVSVQAGLAASAPIPGMDAFEIRSIEVGNGRVKAACCGARRCCSFLEGMARAACEERGASLRYIRQPKRSVEATLTFSVIG